MFKTIYYIFKKSVKISIEEWRYFLSVIISGVISKYLFTVSSLVPNNTLIYLGTVLSAFITSIFSFSLWGRVSRRYYELNDWDFKTNILQGLKATIFLFGHLIIFAALYYSLKIFITSKLLDVILMFIFLLLTLSIFIETLNVFYLDDEIYSLYSVLVRIIKPKFVLAYLLFTVAMYVLGIITDYIVKIAAPYVIWLHISLITSKIFYSYITLLAITIFLYFFNSNMNEGE